MVGGGDSAHDREWEPIWGDPEESCFGYGHPCENFLGALIKQCG